MVKLMKKFVVGDKVFAKVRGYPPWPAKIRKLPDSNKKNGKYEVYFYGTGEKGECTIDRIYEYHDNKDKYGKPSKAKKFLEGMQELEQDLDKDEDKTPSITETKDTAADESEPENNQTTTEPSAGVQLDSDIETGALVIDESDKKKSLKRKSILNISNTPDAPETKKKRGRGKTLTTPVTEAGNDSQGEETTGKEVVSRSGRKIKPKRFADFSADDEYDLETTGRARGRVNKHDESNENISTQSNAKKRMSIEKDDKKLMNKENTNHNLKVKHYTMEKRLLELDAQIKSCLSLDQADTDKCLRAMDDILGLSIDSLALKKHSHIVETVKRLRRYVGNLSEWSLSEEAIKTFKQKAEQIRQKAEGIYNKFKELFTIPDGQSFWQTFSEQVNQFKEITKNMSDEKIFSLMADPTNSESANVNDVSGDEGITQNDAAAEGDSSIEETSSPASK
ncbi:PC4 and SFRS1-interacting protein [Microplitis demolitor]|uniref:PC4 and SFRS1-interacting protein n=1 Tax=Microplitis demolitor TaxID=69319 RepID=UPI0004CDA7A6|nr:PC4 and SFRS1-interacting protein [Microplitis demolitor]